MRRGTRKENKEEDEVEKMLRAAQDEILLNLSINSHLSRPSPSSSSSTIPNPDPDLDLDLERRFQALKTKSKEQGPLDLSARFDALKNKSNHSGNAAVTIPASKTYEESDEEDEEIQIQKLIEWAKDAARLDPSPPSPSVSDNDDDEDNNDDEDDDDDNHRKSVK
ncbi:hypothetical protein P8452_73953 [Trifolium repens]|nr:hypothetical protein P8452_73953 [Trifolium repens]